MNGNDTNYLYLNRDPSWPDFQMDGLEITTGGALQLNSVPSLEGEMPKELAMLPVPTAPAGVAVDIEGTIYFSDPSANRVWRVDGCSGEITRVPCIGTGYLPGLVNAPRGLLIPKYRHALFVADSGNHRIAIFDLNTFQLLDLWGGDRSHEEPQPGVEPGQFDQPWALADDLEGNVYVVDRGNRRVQKFNFSGEVVPAFWDTLNQEHVLRQPSDVAIDPHGKHMATLYVIDSEARKVMVVDSEGRAVRDSNGQPVWFGSPNMDPMGIVATDSAVYVGDNARGRVLTFKKSAGNFVFAGDAVGYHGPVAALALDQNGNLLVYGGGHLPPQRLIVGAGFRTRGVLWSKAITPAVPEVKWHRLSAEMAALASTAHLQIFLYTSDDPNDSPADPSLDASSGNPFSDSRWEPYPLDVSDLFIGRPGRYLWVGALFSGSGNASPVVSQIQVQFNHQGYVDYLPAIYRDYTTCGDFLVRLLSLCESFYTELEDQIAGLPALFDSAATPAEFLPWLADWLALELNESWDEGRRRQLIKEAFEMFGRRGTVEGLRQAVRAFSGVEVVIEEPILNAAWWALPAEGNGCRTVEICPDTAEKNWLGIENSLLGVSTMLTTSEAQGAVTGTTAVLDRSHLITDEEFGAPLFEEVAHQFTAQIHRGQLKCPETLAQIRRVIDHEKPAHVAYHLCIIEPRMRVGYQARIGIDTVVAYEPSAMKLGDGMRLGESRALGGQPAGQVGEQSRVGLTTRIG